MTINSEYETLGRMPMSSGENFIWDWFNESNSET